MLDGSGLWTCRYLLETSVSMEMETWMVSCTPKPKGRQERWRNGRDRVETSLWKLYHHGTSTTCVRHSLPLANLTSCTGSRRECFSSAASFWWGTGVRHLEPQLVKGMSQTVGSHTNYYLRNMRKVLPLGRSVQDNGCSYIIRSTPKKKAGANHAFFCIHHSAPATRWLWPP